MARKLVQINHTLLLNDMAASGKTDAAIIKAASVSKQFFTKLRKKGIAETAAMRHPTIERISRALGQPVARYVVGNEHTNGHKEGTGPFHAPRRLFHDKAVSKVAVVDGATASGVVRSWLTMTEGDRERAATALKTLGVL